MTPDKAYITPVTEPCLFESVECDVMFLSGGKMAASYRVNVTEP